MVTGSEKSLMIYVIKIFIFIVFISSKWKDHHELNRYLLPGKTLIIFVNMHGLYHILTIASVCESSVSISNAAESPESSEFSVKSTTSKILGSELTSAILLQVLRAGDCSYILLNLPASKPKNPPPQSLQSLPKATKFSSPKSSESETVSLLRLRDRDARAEKTKA